MSFSTAFSPRRPDLRDSSKYTMINNRIVQRQPFHSIATPVAPSLGEVLSRGKNSVGINAQIQLTNTLRISNWLDRQKPSTVAGAEALEKLKTTITSNDQVNTDLIKKLEEIREQAEQGNEAARATTAAIEQLLTRNPQEVTPEKEGEADSPAESPADSPDEGAVTPGREPFVTPGTNLFDLMNQDSDSPVESRAESRTNSPSSPSPSSSFSTPPNMVFYNTKPIFNPESVKKGDFVIYNEGIHEVKNYNPTTNEFRLVNPKNLSNVSRIKYTEIGHQVIFSDSDSGSFKIDPEKVYKSPSRRR